MAELLNDVLNKEFINITPHAEVLHSLLSSYMGNEANNPEKSQHTLTSNEAKCLLDGLQNQEILFSVSTHPYDKDINVTYPLSRGPGKINVTIDNEHCELPVYVEGIVITLNNMANKSKDERIHMLRNNPLTIKTLKDAYNRHMEIPTDSPYDKRGKEALPQIIHWFNRFAQGEQWDNLPEFISRRTPERYVGYFTYNELLKDIENTTISNDKLKCIVGRYTLTNDQVTLKNPSYYFFPHS